MDLYSESHPLKFISFRLDMSNDENLPESTNPVTVPVSQKQDELQDVPQEVNEPEKEIRYLRRPF